MQEAASSGEIPRCEAPSLTAYPSASWREPVRTSASTVSEPRSRQAMVAVDEQQTFRGVEDDYGRQGVEHLGVVLHPPSVQVRLLHRSARWREDRLSAGVSSLPSSPSA
jgi:hypothetical protein